MRIPAAVVIVLCTAKPAAACDPAFTRAVVGRPAFEPADAVTIGGESVDVQCSEHGDCTVTWTLSVAAAKAANATVTGYLVQELALAADGRPQARATMPSPDSTDRPTASLAVTPTDTRLVVTARAALPEYIDRCFTAGVIARHPLLASMPKGDRRVLQIDTTAAPRVKHPGSWDLVVDTRDATKYSPAGTTFWFDVHDRLVTHGGPFLLVGGVGGEGGGFHARGGWEASVGPSWLVFALAGETDFADAWNVALTAEPMTRAWVQLPLSFGAGGGVVLASDSRVGGRGQLSIAFGAIRVMLSIDILAPSDGSGADASAGAWIGGGI
jgi:hypothetical protein